MTTIAYKDGLLVSDSRAYSGSSLPIGNKRKMIILDDGSAVAVSTTQPGLAEKIMRWYDDVLHCEEDEEVQIPQVEGNNFYMLLIDADDGVFFSNDSMDLSGPLTADYFAIGSGSDYAMGAMAMGANAIEAVAASIKHDVYSGWPLLVINRNENTEMWLSEADYHAAHAEPALIETP